MTAVIEERRVDERSQEQVELDALVLEKVKAGIELLKKEHGPDFADHIDMGKLDLADGSACVLGQLYGDYDHGESELCGGSTATAAEYGFFTFDDVGADTGAWARLTEAWRRALAK